MLKVSNSLPIANYSQVVISDNAGATFKPKTNSRIRVNLPSTLGMVDFHSSHLQLDLKIVPPANFGTSNSYMVGFGNRQGVNQIVRDLIIRIDGKPLETITNYNVLDKVKRDFANDLTKNNIEAIFSKGTLKPEQPSYFLSAWDTNAGTYSYNNVAVKNQLSLDLSGLLSMKTGFPIVASGDIEIEIILEDADQCLEQKQVLANGCEDTTADAGNGSLSQLTLAPTNVGGANIYRGNNYTTTTSPYAVGNVVILTGKKGGVNFTQYGKVNGNTTTNAGTGKIEVPVDFPNGTFGNGDALSHLVLTAVFNAEDPADKDTPPVIKTTDTYSYEVSNVEYVVRSIEMPPPYLNALQKRIQGEGLVLDCPTYVMYLANIQQNLGKQSLLVPCYSGRVKGVISVPIQSNQTRHNYDRQGKVDSARNFQAKIGGRVEPQRPVDLTNWTNDSQHQFASQEYIQELTKTLIATGLGERSLVNWRDNFVLARSLSAMGGSEDLSEKAFRWEIEYNSNVVSAKNVYNFVNMVKRIQIVPTGVMVFG